MKAYVDTNILIAASVREHPHSSQSRELLRKIKAGEIIGCLSTHGLAEFYAVLTRTPFQPRVHPAEAGHILEANILPYFELLTFSQNDYKEVLAASAREGRVGGVVYDALHIHSARKASCDWIYTFNVRHFRAIAPIEYQNRITSP